MSWLEILFCASLVTLSYTFVGYPLLLMMWAKVRPSSPPEKCVFTPSAVIVVVVHNGAALIKKKIATCLAQDYPTDKLRLLFVSDGSDDATCAMIEASNDPRVSLLALPNRRGKAACINDAVAQLNEEFVIFNDVRQELHRSAVRELISHFLDNEVGAVSGELVFRQEEMTGFGKGIDAYWRYEKVLREAESRVASSVGVTGAIYALRRALFREIPADTILDDVLIPMNVVMQGKRVLFARDAIAYDAPSRNALQERVRKVRTLAGNFQLLFRYPELLLPWRNRIALQFFSHKVLRLLAPVALILALLINIILFTRPHNFWTGVAIATLLAFQLTAYASAFLGMYWPTANRIFVVRLAGAFLSLNWFVVLGFAEFVANRRAHLWKIDTPPTDLPKLPRSSL